MTYEIRCKDAGAACSWHVRAANEQEFKDKLLAHLNSKHGVDRPNDTLVDYLMSVASARQ